MADGSEEVIINGHTVGTENKLTCEFFKRLKPVPIKKLEIASARDSRTLTVDGNPGETEELKSSEEGSSKMVEESLLQGLETFRGHIFDFVLDRVSLGMKKDLGQSSFVPLCNLLLRLIRQSKTEPHGKQRARRLVATLTRGISSRLDKDSTNHLLSRNFSLNLATIVRVLTNVASLICDEDEAAKLLPKETVKYCSVHGIPAVRRRCARGPNKDRRFYVCGMEKDKRCQYFVWADEGDRTLADKKCVSLFGAIVKDSFWNSTLSSGLSHIRICSLFEESFLSGNEDQKSTQLGTLSLPRKKTDDVDPLRECRYTMHTLQKDYNDGVFCSKEKLQGVLVPLQDGNDKVYGSTFEGLTIPHVLGSDHRLILFETVIDLIVHIVDHKTPGVARWLALLCDLIISPDTDPKLKMLSNKALKTLCCDDAELFRSMRDSNSFHFYLRRIYSLTADTISAAVIVKEKCRQCSKNWRDEPVCLSNLNAAGLIGTEPLVSEDYMTEVDRKVLVKALDELKTIAKNRGKTWRQFCGLSSLPPSFRHFGRPHSREREQTESQLASMPPIVALFWIACSSTGINQVTTFRLIELALQPDQQDQSDFELRDHLCLDLQASEAVEEWRKPEDVLFSLNQGMQWGDVTALSINLVRDGKFTELRRVGFHIISKLLHVFTIEDRWAMFRNLFQFVMCIGKAGKAGVEFFYLLQSIAQSLDSREELRSIGDAVIHALRQQLESNSHDRSDCECVLIDSSAGSSSSKKRNIDLSMCLFCCHLSPNGTKVLSSRNSTRLTRHESTRALAGGGSASNVASITTPAQRKWHPEQVSSFSRRRMEMEKTSNEFCLFFQLKYRLAISDFHMNISDPRGRYAKKVNIYFTPRPISDVSDLKSEQYVSKWQRCATLNLSRAATRVSTSLAMSVVAANIKIEFAEFYDRPGEGTRGSDGSLIVLCPRCTCPVSNSHGVCGRCGDAVFQCRKCRHIVSWNLFLFIVSFRYHRAHNSTLSPNQNYDRLDGFFCVECGYCPMGSFSYEVTAGVASNAVAITDERDWERSQKMLGVSMSIEEDLREALRKIQFLKRRQAETSDSDSFFDSDMERALVGLPPTLTDVGREPSAVALLERFGSQGAVVHAVALLDTQGGQSHSSSVTDRSERTRSLLSLARQIRNSAVSTSDRRQIARGINLDNLEEILESGNIFEPLSSREQLPESTSGRDPKANKRERNRKSEFQTCHKLVLLMREAEKECTELRRRLDAWTALNNGSLPMATFRDIGDRDNRLRFSPSHCCSCSAVVACCLLELWQRLIEIGPSYARLNPGMLDVLLDAGGATGLLESKKKAVVSIATASSSGAELVLNGLRSRLAASPDTHCADILGKILQEDSPGATEFTRLAMEILASRSSEP
jgi:hypothetical protein